MTTPTTPPDMVEVVARVEAALSRMTQGPYDAGHGLDLVRGLRGDMAVPIFEARSIYGDPHLPAPGARNCDGGWIYRANSHDARFSAAMGQQQRNAKALAEILNDLPQLLAALRTRTAEKE